jgi:hypothetical protein
MSGGDHRDKTNSQSTRGIMLFGVPSQRMNINSLRGIVEGQANQFFLPILREGSDTLRNQIREFSREISLQDQIVSFYETELSPSAKKVSGLRLYVASVLPLYLCEKCRNSSN